MIFANTWTRRSRLGLLAALILPVSFANYAQAQRNQSELPEYDFQEITAAEYQKAFNQLWPKGYRPSDASVKEVDGEIRFSLTMKKPKIAIDCIAKHLLEDEDFQKLADECDIRNFTLRTHQEFEWEGENRHLAIWVRVSKSKPLEPMWRTAKKIPSTGKSNRKVRPLDDLMQQFIYEHQIPGATIAVSYRGEVVYERGFGFSNLEEEQGMQPNTRMRIASVSKPITATAIMKLVEEGKLDLHTKVFESLIKPEHDTLDERIFDITVAHLLRHRGGWDRSKSYDPMFAQKRVSEYFERDMPMNTKEIIHYMLRQPLDFAPDEREAYSNFGYCVLGRVIEKVTGMKYDEYVQQELFSPIEIESMEIGKTLESELLEGESHYYTRDGQLTGQSVVEPEKYDQLYQYGGWHQSSLDAHGGWVGSAKDLVLFASEFDDPENCDFFSSETMANMFVPIDLTTVRPRRGARRYYAYGWNVVIGKNGSANVFHMGRLNGTSALLVRRHDGFNWAILFNCDSGVDGKGLANLIDPLVHQAINAIDW